MCACVLTYPCDLPPSLPPQPHGASAHPQASDPLGWPKPRNSGREGRHGPGVTVAPSQMGLRLARDPTHSLWGRRCSGSVVLGGRPVAPGCQFAGVSGRPLCWGSWNETRPSLRPRIPKPGEGVGAERRRCGGGLTLEVAEEPSGGRVSRCPGEGLAVRPWTPMGGAGGGCAPTGREGSALPPPRGRPATQRGL